MATFVKAHKSSLHQKSFCDLVGRGVVTFSRKCATVTTSFSGRSREAGIDLQLSRGCDILFANSFTTMEEGIIARVTDKGFGFIKREGKEKDLFFHSNELVGVSFEELREGDKVTFEVSESAKGPNATKVSRV